MQDNGVNRVFFQNKSCILMLPNSQLRPALSMACLWWMGAVGPGETVLHFTSRLTACARRSPIQIPGRLHRWTSTIPRGNCVAQIQPPVLTPPHNKRGQLNLNYPLKDVASKMPLLIFPAEKMHKHPRSHPTR